METQKQEPEQIKNEVQSLDIEKKETVSEDGTRLEHIKEALEILYKTFPKAFVKDGDIKPLKIGIFDDIKDRASSIEGLSLSKVRSALRMYTTRLKYLYSLKAGAHRIDIDGNEIEDVLNAEHEAYAKEKVSQINAKRNVNKKPVRKDNKKNFKQNRVQGKGARKAFKVDGIKGTQDNLKLGTNVLVLSSEQRFVRGVVAQDASKDTVRVTLNSGLTLTLPLDRVLLPKTSN